MKHEFPTLDRHYLAAVLTVSEMSAADRAAVRAGVPGHELMENAGAAVAHAVRLRFPPGPVLVLCGPGNNGGDGFVAARHLRARGWPVTVALSGKLENLAGDAAFHARRWSGPVVTLDPIHLRGAHLVIDALFGAGLSRPLTGAVRRVVEAVNRARRARGLRVVAIDLPSGIAGDTGDVLGAAPVADLTVTFFRKKTAHLIDNKKDMFGEIIVEQIGIPAGVLPGIAPSQFENGPLLWAEEVPGPAPADHKYRRGHLLVLGGPEMTGAARLAATAARRVGAGLGTIGAPADALPAYRTGDPGLLTAAAGDGLAVSRLARTRKRNAAVAGPGLGVCETTRERVMAILDARLPAVLDADGLTVFADAPETLFRAHRGNLVLTPHEGEFSRLFNKVRGVLTKDSRIARVRAAARISGAVVLLKGPTTVISDPEGRVLLNCNAPADLATGGTGDTLSGLIGGLLAQGVSPFTAAGIGAWMHGAAARRVGPGLIAEDLAVHLPPVLARLRAMARRGPPEAPPICG